MTRELFTVRFNKSTADVDAAELSKLLQIGKGTLERWRTGQSAPHPIGMSTIMLVVEERYGYGRGLGGRKCDRWQGPCTCGDYHE